MLALTKRGTDEVRRRGEPKGHVRSRGRGRSGSGCSPPAPCRHNIHRRSAPSMNLCGVDVSDLAGRCRWIRAPSSCPHSLAIFAVIWTPGEYVPRCTIVGAFSGERIPATGTVCRMRDSFQGAPFCRLYSAMANTQRHSRHCNKTYARVKHIQVPSGHYVAPINCTFKHPCAKRRTCRSSGILALRRSAPSSESR